MIDRTFTGVLGEFSQWMCKKKIKQMKRHKHL